MPLKLQTGSTDLAAEIPKRFLNSKDVLYSSEKTIIK